ncbi:MAG: hypothetical protein HQL02_12265 [Nitrospirae bacterium]|nr:hypothetical protein [Nitrospirota bacterium]
MYLRCPTTSSTCVISVTMMRCISYDEYFMACQCTWDAFFDGCGRCYGYGKLIRNQTTCKKNRVWLTPCTQEKTNDQITKLSMSTTNRPNVEGAVRLSVVAHEAIVHGDEPRIGRPVSVGSRRPNRTSVLVLAYSALLNDFVFILLS